MSKLAKTLLLIVSAILLTVNIFLYRDRAYSDIRENTWFSYSQEEYTCTDIITVTSASYGENPQSETRYELTPTSEGGYSFYTSDYAYELNEKYLISTTTIYAPEPFSDNEYSGERYKMENYRFLSEVEFSEKVYEKADELIDETVENAMVQKILMSIIVWLVFLGVVLLYDDILQH